MDGALRPMGELIDPSAPILLAIMLVSVMTAAWGIARYVLIRRKDGEMAAVVDPGPFRVGDLCWAGLLLLVFSLPVLVMFSGETGSEGAGVSAGALVGAILQQVVLTVATVVFVSMRPGVGDWLGIRWREWKLVVWLGPLCVALMWGLLFALELTGYQGWLKQFGVDEKQGSVTILKESQDLGLLSMLCLAALVVAPVCEEIMFRGYGYRVLKKYGGPRVAACVTSLVFACVHANVASVVPLFLLGLLLVRVYEKHGSIWAPIAVHFCFNAATVTVHLGARWLEIPLDPSL